MGPDWSVEEKVGTQSASCLQPRSSHGSSRSHKIVIAAGHILHFTCCLSALILKCWCG